MMKKLICCIVSVLTFGAVLPFSAAASQQDSGNVFFSSNATPNGAEAISALRKNNSSDWNIKNENMEKLLKELRENAMYNVVVPITSIDCAGITELCVDANSTGIVIVPSDSDKFVFEYVGVENTPAYSVSITTSDKKLTAYIHAANSDIPRYMLTEPDKIANSVRIYVPKSSEAAISVESNFSPALICGNFNQQINVDCENGSVIFDGDSISKAFKIKTVNGFVTVKAPAIRSDVTLSSINGNINILSDDISADFINASCINGKINLKCQMVNSALISTVNGNISVGVGTIVNGISAESVNGNVDIAFDEQPQNLSLFTDFRMNSSLNYPQGWGRSYSIGNGVPSLKIKIGNGQASITVAD